MEAVDNPWSGMRTVAITGMLAGFIAFVIVVFCAIIGFTGSLLVESNIVEFERLIAPDVGAELIFFGSITLAVILAVCLYRTLGVPLRQMTAAMEELARGNFEVRMPERGGWHLREVNEFARAFNTAAAELGGTEMMRTGFISDFSHEFRTPISSLSGFAQLLQEDDLTPEDRTEYLQIIVDESQHLAGLSERILLLSKMEASTILPDVQDVSVTESVRRASTIVEQEAAAMGVNLALSLGECRMRGNGDYLVQLWTNLLDNAIKFSPRGSTVSVALHSCRDDRTPTAPDCIVCRVSDEGPGMDEHTHTHMFDRFYQGDASHTGKGNGLGLALCKRIVELHGGTIEATSNPGEGSTFEVKLPARMR